MPNDSRDMAIARLARQAGMATPDQLGAALKVQGQAIELGKPISLIDALVQVGAITSSQQEVLENAVKEEEERPDIQQISDYRLLRKLGEGGVGAVYLAEDTREDRKVALKVIHPGNTADPDFIRRFIREVDAAIKLDHPNIARAFEAGEESGHLFYAMEYCEGESLDKALKRQGPFPWRHALELVLQVARGLAYAHRKGFIHRDLKPGNIFLTTKGEAKILDFGLVKKTTGPQMSFGTVAGAVLGTPQYIPPEQVKGIKEIDGRADIYSLGATLYHLITGEFPFPGTTLYDVLSQHVKAEIPNPQDVLEDIPYGVVHIIRKMMAKRPEDRFRDCEELIDNVSGFLEETEPEPGASPETYPVPTAEAPRGRSYFLWGGVGMAGAALVIFMLVVLGKSGLSRIEPPAPKSDAHRESNPEQGERQTNNVEEANTRAARLAWEKANAFMKEHPGDLEGQIALFEEVILVAQGTEYSEQAIVARALLVRLITDIPREMAGLDEQARLLTENENFKAVLELLGQARKKREVQNWTALIDGKIWEINRSVYQLLDTIKERAAADRLEGRTEEVRKARDRVARWGLPDRLEAFDAFLSGVSEERALARGLAAWWKMDEGSGTTLEDASRWGRKGTLGGGASWTDGRLGKALSFDGKQAHVRIHPFFESTQNTFTISLWAFPRADMLVTKEQNTGPVELKGHRFAVFPTHGRHFGNGHSGVGISIGTNGVSIFEHADGHFCSPLVHAVAIQGWTHVAVVYSDRVPVLFINGTREKVGLRSSKIVHPSCELGGGSGTYGTYDGHLDDVRIYNRALSDAEIGGLFKGNTGGVNHSSATTSDSLVIYSNGTIAKEWEGRSLGSEMDLKAEAPNGGGRICISFTPVKALATLSFEASKPVDFAEYGSIAFEAWATAPVNRFDLSLRLEREGTNDLVKGFSLAFLGGGPPVGYWSRYDFPIEHLPAGKLKELSIRIITGNNQPVLYMDNLVLRKRPPSEQR